jgi:uncharacterized SAM-binding protein YcdF (DUF218 family)
MAAGVVGLATWAGAGWWIDRVGVASAGPPAPGCAVAVLGARVDEGGIASATLAARVREGLEASRSGALLVISGGVGDFPPAESEVGRALALDAGIAPHRIRVETNSHSTRENARESAKVLRQEGVACVQLVSDPYHLARARWAFDREGLAVTLRPVLDAPRHRSFASRVWWTAREVPAFVKMMVSE